MVIVDVCGFYDDDDAVCAITAITSPGNKHMLTLAQDSRDWGAYLSMRVAGVAVVGLAAEKAASK